jgi:hypothetical protein
VSKDLEAQSVRKEFRVFREFQEIRERLVKLVLAEIRETRVYISAQSRPQMIWYGLILLMEKL